MRSLSLLLLFSEDNNHVICVCRSRATPEVLLRTCCFKPPQQPRSPPQPLLRLFCRLFFTSTNSRNPSQRQTPRITYGDVPCCCFANVYPKAQQGIIKHNNARQGRKGGGTSFPILVPAPQSMRRRLFPEGFRRSNQQVCTACTRCCVCYTHSVDAAKKTLEIELLRGIFIPRLSFSYLSCLCLTVRFFARNEERCSGNQRRQISCPRSARFSSLSLSQSAPFANLHPLQIRRRRGGGGRGDMAVCGEETYPSSSLQEEEEEKNQSPYGQKSRKIARKHAPGNYYYTSEPRAMHACVMILGSSCTFEAAAASLQSHHPDEWSLFTRPWL